MTMSQKGGLWNSVDLLSLETTELIKADSNPSFFDADSDLCLRSLSTTGTDKVGIRFISPSTRYQFIEIDLISSTGVTVSVSASTESQAGLAFHGEIVVADLKITPFVLRTYRFPFLGEIESFVFSGFTSAASVNVKAIRFFTTPDRLVAGVAPETTPSLSVNTAHLTVDGVQVPRVGSIYQLDVSAGSTLTTTAVFTFDTLTVSQGLIKVLVSQQNHADLEIDILDQTGLTTPYQLTTGYAEIFVTGEQKTVSMIFYNLSGAEAAHVCIELDNFQAIQPSNAFGTAAGVVVSPLAGILEFICGAGSGSGTGGAPVDATFVTMSANSTLTNERILTAGTGISITDNGANNTVVIATTGGAPSGGTSNSTEFTGSGNWTVPAGVTAVWITAIGGGAGGFSPSAVNFNGGGGGGSGEQCAMLPMAVTPGAVMPVIIGAGGTGGASGGAGNGNSGNPGGATSIGPFSFLGGRPGIMQTGGPDINKYTGGPGGGWNGGLPTNNNGVSGNASAVSFFGGGSGGSGGWSGNPGFYGAGSGGILLGGAGGVTGGSYFGGGGGAASPYGTGGVGGTGNGGAGGNGVGAGSGGGGGGGNNGKGGDGKAGYLLIMFVA